MTTNPYAPPETEPSSAPKVQSKRLRRGPALFIVGFGLLGGFGAVPFLMRQNSIAFAVPLIGCVVGGLIYRLRARNWPRDPTILRRQLVYSAIAVFLPPAVLLLTAGPYGQGPAIIGLIVGFSVACGIFASGTKRLNASRENSEHSDTPEQ